MAGHRVENDPQAPDGYVFRAMAEANQKQPDKAEADLNRAIQLAPENPWVLPRWANGV
jgi:Tfp pilus assembly protein PilF